MTSVTVAFNNDGEDLRVAVSFGAGLPQVGDVINLEAYDWDLVGLRDVKNVDRLYVESVEHRIDGPPILFCARSVTHKKVEIRINQDVRGDPDRIAADFQKTVERIMAQRSPVDVGVTLLRSEVQTLVDVISMLMANCDQGIGLTRAQQAPLVKLGMSFVNKDPFGND